MEPENQFSSDNEARQILFHGGLLTLLSLLSGFTVYFAVAPRIALSSHTVGLLQGVTLIAIAGAWHLLKLSPTALKIIKYTLIVGFYGNWISLQLAALWGAGKSGFPILGNQIPDGAAPWQDLTVTILGILSVLIVVSAALIAWAAYSKKKS